MSLIITGFHAIEEKIHRAVDDLNGEGFTLFISKTGPRVKKIVELAKKVSISCNMTDDKSLDRLVQDLNEAARDHRGIVLMIDGKKEDVQNKIDFDIWIKEHKGDEQNVTVLILDSVTDPHNVGAILRSCDQFGCDLVVMPARHSANNFQENEIIARSSAGANSYVNISIVTNLVRCVQMLKDAGFWVYAADAGGQSVAEIKFSSKTAIVMGSEGSGISRLLQKECDCVVSIPTCGKIDSLNVSVAAGVLLYENYRQKIGV